MLSKRVRSRQVSRKIVEFLIAGHGVNHTCRVLKVGKDRVRKVRELAEKAGYLSGMTRLPVFPEALFPEQADAMGHRSSAADRLLQEHKEWIIEKLKVGWHAITIFEELPVKVSRSSFYRFFERHDLILPATPPRVVPEIVHRPGEALLVDWGKVGTVVCQITGKRLTVWAFVGVLGYSRYRMVRLTLRQDFETTVALMESMFQEIGGVPTRLTSDNPKCFALKACRYEPQLNPLFERFAAYYDFTVECLPPRDPEKKGKVERPMPFIRRLFEPFGDGWSDLKKAQSFIDDKLRLANDKRHGTTGEPPTERFNVGEKAALKALPTLTWQREEYHEGTVRTDGHVRFRGKYYSVEESLIGKEVQIIGNQSTVLIYCAGKLVETHERVLDSLKSKSTKDNHLKPWERAMTDVSIFRDRAKNIGPYVDALVLRLIGNGLGMIDFRKVWGVLSLDKTYEASAIDEACKAVLETSSISFKAVRMYLDMNTKKREVKRKVTSNDKPSEYPPSKDLKTQNCKFVRDITEYGHVVANAKTPIH